MQSLRLAALGAIHALFGERQMVAVATGWRTLAQDQAVIQDLIHLGHVFEDPQIDPETGKIYSHEDLLARAARKGLVLQLLARAEVTQDELNLIRKQGVTPHEVFSIHDTGAAARETDVAQ